MSVKNVPKCPHCGRLDCVATVVYRNVENYDSQRVFDLPCRFCGKMICVSASRSVSIHEVKKSTKERSESDFAI